MMEDLCIAPVSFDPSACHVLLSPALLLHVVQYLHAHDVGGLSIIDVIISDARYRPAWLELLR
jgi:hypothetical protein